MKSLDKLQFRLPQLKLLFSSIIRLRLIEKPKLIEDDCKSGDSTTERLHLQATDERLGNGIHQLKVSKYQPIKMSRLTTLRAARSPQEAFSTSLVLSTLRGVGGS